MPDELSFCTSCGFKLNVEGKTCQRCGMVNPSVAAFCSGCGMPLGSPIQNQVPTIDPEEQRRQNSLDVIKNTLAGNPGQAELAGIISQLEALGGYKDAAVILADCKEKLSSIQYAEASEQFAKADEDKSLYFVLEKRFEKLGDYKDSKEKYDVCKSYCDAVRAKKRKKIAIISSSCVAAVIAAFLVIKVIIPNGNGGSVSKSSISVVFGDSYSIPTPTKNGYDFTGWSTSSYPSYYASKFPSSGIWNTDGNVTLYAQWELHKYTLTIDPNGGSFSGSRTRSVTYGSSVYLGSSYRTGYEFDGWYYGGTELGYSSFTYDFEDDITVKARWTPETYSVRLNANGGSGVPSSYTLTYGERYSLPTPTRDGYTFDGWYTSSYGGSRFSSSGIWESTSNPYSLYARWTAAPAPTTTP